MTRNERPSHTHIHTYKTRPWLSLTRLPASLILTMIDGNLSQRDVRSSSSRFCKLAGKAPELGWKRQWQMTKRITSHDELSSDIVQHESREIRPSFWTSKQVKLYFCQTTAKKKKKNEWQSYFSWRLCNSPRCDDTQGFLSFSSSTV